jgi:amino acid adenylation domain-containing protein
MRDPDATSRKTSRDLNAAAAVFRFAQTQPTTPALVVDGRGYSYADLRTESRKVAAWLQLAAGDAHSVGRVGILASRSLETYAGMLGAAWAGGTYVPVNPKLPPARLASVLGQAGLCALLADERGLDRLADAQVRAAAPKPVLAMSRPPWWPRDPHAGLTLWGELSQDDAPDEPVEVAPSHPVYVIFTSGTTGVPKGVTVSASNLACFLTVVRSLYAIGPDDRVGQFCETSFDLSVFEIFAAFDGGACLYVVPESKLMAPAGFIRRHALSVWASVPSAISILSRMKLLEPGSLPSLRVSFLIGEALSVDLARAWQRAAPGSVVDNHYGPTEATVACTMQRLTEPVVETPGRGTVAIGKPYDAMAVEVVGADGCFLNDGETGEIALKGPQVAIGYLGDDAQTSRRFVSLEHPRLGVGRWYLTGDLGCRDRDGVLHCLGRVDHQVKVLGHRIELEDLEAHLRAASGTDAVAAVAWPVVDGTATGIAAFVCGAAASLPEIREKLLGLVPSYMVPRQIRAVDALPLSASGKVDREALRSMLERES